MKHCPNCKRPTRPKTSSRAEYPGTVCMMRNDGTCMSCMQDEVEQRKAPVTEARTRENRRTLEQYMAKRRNRRVPVDGFQDAEGVPA